VIDLPERIQEVLRKKGQQAQDDRTKSRLNAYRN
jgi:hypothetical protein